MKRKLYVPRLVTLLCSIAGFAQAPPSCTPAHYKLIPLPLQPARINSSGLITGITEDQKLVTWTEKGGAREVKVAKGFASAKPSGINTSGEIVGQAQRNGSEQPIAFAYSNGRFSILSQARSQASAINDAGDIAGRNARQLVLWRKGKAIPLGGCCGGEAHGINNHGEVIGQVNDKEGRYSAFLWDAAHQLRSIAPPDSTMSTAVAINDKGQVLVQSLTPPAIFLLRDGKYDPVPLSPEFASQPLALNDCDVIVGEFGAASDFYHAFIWDPKNGFRDLNQLIDASTGWTLEKALDINHRGEIVGLGDHGNEEDAGFLLVPQP